jgi:hypothetical protein
MQKLLNSLYAVGLSFLPQRYRQNAGFEDSDELRSHSYVGCVRIRSDDLSSYGTTSWTRLLNLEGD